MIYIAFLEVEDVTYSSEVEHGRVVCITLELNMAVTKMGYAKQRPISVYKNNQSAYTSRGTTRTMHIDVIHHFVRKQSDACLSRY